MQMIRATSGQVHPQLPKSMHSGLRRGLQLQCDSWCPLQNLLDTVYRNFVAVILHVK